jgi:hypothetical protein
MPDGYAVVLAQVPIPEEERLAYHTELLSVAVEFVPLVSFSPPMQNTKPEEGTQDWLSVATGYGEVRVQLPSPEDCTEAK